MDTSASAIKHDRTDASVWFGVLLATPALAFWCALALNAFAESMRMRGKWIEGIVTSGAMFGGLFTLLSTPLQFVHLIVQRRSLSDSARFVLYGLLFVGVGAAILVLRHLIGLSDLS